MFSKCSYDDASLTPSDLEQINQCRRDYHRLGFGYQVGFVQLENRFPIQQPLEIIPDLLTFISVQSLGSRHLIRTGKDRGARLIDRLENLAVISPETWGYLIEMRSLAVPVRKRLEEIDGTLKIAVVQIIDDVSEFTIEQSSATYEDRLVCFINNIRI